MITAREKKPVNSNLLFKAQTLSFGSQVAEIRNQNNFYIASFVFSFFLFTFFFFFNIFSELFLTCFSPSDITCFDLPLTTSFKQPNGKKLVERFHQNP